MSGLAHSILMYATALNDIIGLEVSLDIVIATVVLRKEEAPKLLRFELD